MPAIQSATIVAAKLLGIEELTGSLSAGKSADIIAAPRSPFEDVAVMEEVFFVMKEGVVYRHTTPTKKTTDIGLVLLIHCRDTAHRRHVNCVPLALRIR